MDVLRVNLALLKGSHPELAAKFSAFEPSSIVLSTAQENELLIGGEGFYGGDGKIACAMQVEAFFQHPTHFSASYKSERAYWAHQEVINALNEEVSKYGTSAAPSHSTLIALGSGLGYYFDMLAARIGIRHFVLVEPDDDMLYAFLSTVNLKELLASGVGESQSFTIIQPDSVDSFSRMISMLAERVGYDLFSALSIYKHYETELFDALYESLPGLRHQWLSSWGFFEDEWYGARHTHSNVMMHPVYSGEEDTSKARSALCDVPVVIVGNGPSLDICLDALRRKQENCLVVSCGTALATLTRSGILPDFHLEMERSRFTTLVQEKWYTEDIAKKTTLLALNTVSPEITSRFESVLLFAKSRDLGTVLLNQACDPPVTALSFCNPTVTNFAISAASRLGFSKLILLGCDYGYREQGRHHASKSDYFSADSRLNKVAPTADAKVADNHGGSVFTTRILSVARANVEKVLALSPQTEVINCSDGAQIAHTRWEGFEHLDFPSVDKTQLKADFLRDAPFQHINDDTFNLTDKFAQLRDSVEEIVAFSHGKVGAGDLLSSLNALQKYVGSGEDAVVKTLLFSGVAKYLSVCIAGHLNKIENAFEQSYSEFAAARVKELFSTYLQLFERFSQGDKNEV